MFLRGHGWLNRPRESAARDACGMHTSPAALRSRRECRRGEDDCTAAAREVVPRRAFASSLAGCAMNSGRGEADTFRGVCGGSRSCVPGRLVPRFADASFRTALSSRADCRVAARVPHARAVPRPVSAAACWRPTACCDHPSRLAALPRAPGCVGGMTSCRTCPESAANKCPLSLVETSSHPPPNSALQLSAFRTGAPALVSLLVAFGRGPAGPQLNAKPLGGRRRDLRVGLWRRASSFQKSCCWLSACGARITDARGETRGRELQASGGSRAEFSFLPRAAHAC